MPATQYYFENEQLCNLRTFLTIIHKFSKKKKNEDQLCNKPVA